MASLANPQWETFCIQLFSGEKKQDAAILAGYSARSAHSIASRLLKLDKIVARLSELQGEVASDTIMSEIERQERLSTFGREDITSPKTGTLQRMGNIGAIQELNKMDGAYKPQRVALEGEVTLIIKEDGNE